MVISKMKKSLSGFALMEVIAISAGALVNIYLAFLVVDANTGYNTGIDAASPIVRAVSLFIIGFVLLWMIFKTQSLRLDFLVISLVAYIAFGSLVGFVRNGLSYEFFRHLFAAATMLSAYWAGRFLQFKGLHIDKTLRFWAWMSVAGGVLAWVIGYRTLENGAFSMSPVTQILPLSVSLTTGAAVMFALSLSMIAFGNKRDVIIGASILLSAVFVKKYFSYMNSVLRVFVGAISAVAISLIIFIGVSQSTKMLTYLGVPLSGNLSERSNRVVDFFDEEERDREKGTDGTKFGADAPPADLDSIYWKLERFTSSRLSLATSVFNSVVDSKYGYIFGNGFGGSYYWRYWSNNNESWEEYVFHQTDLMPLWFFLTSGTFIALMVVGGVFWNLLSIFIYTSRVSIEIPALLVLGACFSMLLSFQPNVPLFWLFLGAMSTRITPPKQ